MNASWSSFHFSIGTFFSYSENIVLLWYIKTREKISGKKKKQHLKCCCKMQYGAIKQPAVLKNSSRIKRGLHWMGREIIAE